MQLLLETKNKTFECSATFDMQTHNKLYSVGRNISAFNMLIFAKTKRMASRTPVRMCNAWRRARGA